MKKFLSFVDGARDTIIIFLLAFSFLQVGNSFVNHGGIETVSPKAAPVVAEIADNYAKPVVTSTFWKTTTVWPDYKDTVSPELYAKQSAADRSQLGPSNNIVAPKPIVTVVTIPDYSK